MLKVMTIAGTRPEIIRLSRIIATFDSLFSHVLVHTGQNYDASLKDIFFDQLGVRRPDHSFNVDLSTIGATLSDLFLKIEKLLLAEKPDAVLILGDTNSALSCIIAKKQGIPIYHMEAGNRCFDRESPEEANRRIVDHTCDFNLAYTEAARRNLLNEGLHPRRVYVTGSPLLEVIQHYRSQIDQSVILTKLDLRPRSYFAASIHRQETVDTPERIKTIFDALGQLHRLHGQPVILSTHPRTLQKLEQFAIPKPKGIHFLEPFGYFDWCHLQMMASCVVSDSGTVSEEAAMLNFPAVTPRNSMERPEAMDCGNVVLCGITPESIVQSVSLMMQRAATQQRQIPEAYCVTGVSHTVAALITGTCRLSRNWVN
ncbi:unnamed protein product [Phaeothamnion confervicola]